MTQPFVLGVRRRDSSTYDQGALFPLFVTTPSPSVRPPKNLSLNSYIVDRSNDKGREHDFKLALRLLDHEGLSKPALVLTPAFEHITFYGSQLAVYRLT